MSASRAETGRGWRLLLGAGALGLVLDQLLGGPGAGRPLLWLALLFNATPLLRRVAPREPAVLKTLLFSWLFSPLLVAAIWMLMGTLAPLARRELTLAALLLLLLAGLLQGRNEDPRTASDAAPLPRGGLGGAQLVALGVAIGFTLLVAGALFQGAAARASFHGLLHSSILEATSMGLPPENPWLAGVSLGYYWVWHALGAAVGELLGLAPTRALAALNVWAAASLPLSAYFFAAPLWRRARLDLAAVGLGLLGLNLMGGLVWLAGDASFTPPTVWTELLANLRGLVFGDVDPRLAWGPSKFGNLSSYPAALALFAGGLVAAGHALRGGIPADEHERSSQRTWSGLAAAALGASTLLNPLVGAAGFLATGLVAVSRKRFGFLALCLICAAPGVWEVLAAGAEREGASVALSLSRASLLGPLGALAPLFLGALLSALLARPREAGPRAFFDLAWAGALSSLLVAACTVLPEANEYKFVRTAAWFLAPLAAGAPFVLWERGQVARIGGVALGALWLVGAGASSYLGVRSYAAWSQVPMALSEEAGVLLPAGQDDLSLAMAQLRAWSTSSEKRPVLILNPPPGSAVGWDYEGTRFTDGFNLQGHEAAAFSGAALFCDRRSYLVDADPAWPARLGLVRALFQGEPGAARALEQAVAASTFTGRPLYLLAVGNAPPESTRNELAWEERWSSGDVKIFAAP